MIYVLIPVHNRLEFTQNILHALRSQSLYNQVKIVVIDDGSTDGTSDFLIKCNDVITLKGNGDLWWAGAMQKGLNYLCEQGLHEDDYVVFLNNDTWFGSDYISTLVQTSINNNGSAVGSVIHEPDRSMALTSIGPKININRLAVWDLISELSPDETHNLKSTYYVDALSGRGSLYPANLFKKFGQLRPFLLPHYLADYEISMRFKYYGVPLVVSTNAIVYSPSVFGNDVSNTSWWYRCFSKRSSSNIAYNLIFYMLVGTTAQRITAPLRFIYFSLSRRTRSYFK